MTNKFIKDNCREDGTQKYSNLDKEENDGLKRSRSRVVNVLPSDYMRYELDQLCQVFENFQTGMTKKQEMD